MKNHELRKNELSTRLVVIDQGYIKKHCLEKEFWLNSWNVFEYKNFKATVRLNQINVKYSTYTLEMSIGSFTQYADFPLNREDFTDVMFNKKLFTLFRSIMENYVSDFELRRTKEYDGYKDLDYEFCDMAKEKAKKYCEEHGITESNIIDAIESQYVGDANTNHANNFVSENKTKIHPDVVAAFAYWMGFKEEATELDKLIDPKIRKRLIARYLVDCQRFEAIKQGAMDEDAEI